MKFDSKKELKRYNELVLLERAGEISSLRRQVTFTLLNAAYEEVPVQLKTKIRFKRVCLFRETTYVADFVYYKDGEEVVESGWFDRAHLPEIPLKGSIARAMIDAWLEE